MSGRGYATLGLAVLLQACPKPATEKPEPLNQSPVVQAIDDQLVLINTRAEIKWSAQDDDPLKVELVGLGELSTSTAGDHGVWSLTASTATSGVAWIVVTDGALTSSTSFNVTVVDDAPVATVASSTPNEGPGNETWIAHLIGDDIAHGGRAYLGDVALPTRVKSRRAVDIELPPHPRGDISVVLRQGDKRSQPFSLRIGNSAVVFGAERSHRLQEGRQHQIKIEAKDPDGDAFRILPTSLPPGATYQHAQSILQFEPDYFQGGRSYSAKFAAFDASRRSDVELDLQVDDSKPFPAIEVVETLQHRGFRQLVLRQTSDNYLDAPQVAGRQYEARVIVPDTDRPLPVRVYLHGFGGAPFRGGQADAYRIYPHDPDNTYWWGYRNKSGRTEPYTARRVLHLLDWLLKTHSHADADRVYLHGSSMGGAGAAQIAAFFPRHFAFAESFLGQTVARFHRPSRRTQLSGIWGPYPKAPVWQQLDLSRRLRDSAEARNQWYFFYHAKDDPIIHFDTALRPSPQTRKNLYQSLSDYRVGHLAVWDEGAHGPPDPVLGPRWWKSPEPAATPIVMLARNQPFIAFSNSSLDPERAGVLKTALDPEIGAAGDPSVPEDSGYGAPYAGGQGRFLGWNQQGVVDSSQRFEVSLFIESGGRPAERPDYPSLGRGHPTATAATVDVTVRRAQQFVLRPKEKVIFRFGRQQGRVSADQDGVVTVPELNLTKDPQTLSMERAVPLFSE